jgi:TetR/AcrR family transcriptional regulator, mexJK operon transcriptional repressor
MDSDQHTRHRPGVGRESSAPKARRAPGRRTPTQTKLRNLELLDKALDLFLEKGFERTTIDEISASVGMAKRTVYLRFGNKTKLFKASLQRAIEEWIVPVHRLQAAESGNVEETLLRVGQILVANVISPAGLRLLRITNAESGRMPEIGAFTCKQGTEPTLAYLADLFRRRIRPGDFELPNPDEAALAFLYFVVGGPASMTAWGIALDEQGINRHTRYCVHLFLHGLLDPDHEVAGTNATMRGRGGRRQMAHSPPAARDALKLKLLEEENRRLKVLLAESMLESVSLRQRPIPR